jgi:replicative DNA helicase
MTARPAVAATSLCALHLEQGALACALEDPQKAAELIRDGHVGLFSSTTNQNIFLAIRELGPEALDPFLLEHELDRQGGHVDFGILTSLDHGVVFSRPMAYYLARLQEQYKLRQLARLGERLQAASFEVGVRATDLIVKVRSWLSAIESDGEVGE